MLLLAIECLCDDLAHHDHGIPPGSIALLCLGALVVAAWVAWAYGEVLVWARPKSERVPSPGSAWLSESAPSCPFCRGAFEAEAPALRCPRCEVRQHHECWHDHGGCSTFGCARGPGKERRAA